MRQLSLLDTLGPWREIRLGYWVRSTAMDSPIQWAGQPISGSRKGFVWVVGAKTGVRPTVIKGATKAEVDAAARELGWMG